MKKTSENPILTIRLNGAEHARFWRLMDEAKARNPYASKSDILRELLGLAVLTVLTKDEVHFFRTGEKRSNVFKNDEILRPPIEGELKDETTKKRRRA